VIYGLIVIVYGTIYALSMTVTGKGMQLEVVETPPVGPVTALHFTDQYLISGE